VKRALVTGGSGALGSAIALKLAADGHHVYVHANSARSLAEKTAGEIVSRGGSAQAVAFDVVDFERVRASLEALLAEGPIQILINSAGIHDDAIMPSMRRQQWLGVIDVSLNGFFNVTQPLLMPMIGTRWGRIVNISSVAAQIGGLVGPHYAASKAGMLGLTRSYAQVLAKEGITVNSVCPALIDTEMVRSNPRANPGLIPIGRFGTVEEVALVVLMLVGNAYMTGQAVNVNGGWYVS